MVGEGRKPRHVTSPRVAPAVRLGEFVGSYRAMPPAALEGSTPAAAVFVTSLGGRTMTGMTAPASKMPPMMYRAFV